MIPFDDLDLVGLLERERQAHADIAAAGDHDAAHRVLEAPHLAHEHTNVLAVGDEENLVALLDHRIAVRQHGFTLAIDRRNAAFGIRDVLFERRDALADEQAVAIGFDADEPHASVREVEHLG